MLPSILAKQLEKGIGDYIETTFPMTNAPFKGSLTNMLAAKDALYHDPYIAVRLPFRVAKEMPTCFEAVHPAYLPYVHQQKAFDRLTGDDGRSTLVATGTGSGKTECFLYPILEYCYQHRGERGIKALIIYPMNALASDQAKRIAELVWTSPEMRGNVTVGMYVGGHDHKAGNMMSETTVITDRVTMLNNPPDILLTNYKMLDYLLVRPTDADLWKDNKDETLKYIAVDELHTFDGAQGTDLACLLRRLKSRLGIQPGFLCCVGTSATMGGKDSSDSIRGYASEIFGEPFERDAVITEDRLSAAEFFAGNEITDFGMPSPEQIDELNGRVAQDDQDAYLRSAVSAWLTDFTEDPLTDEGRLAIGARLMHHSFAQSMITLMGGNYYQEAAIVDGLKTHYPALNELGDGQTAMDALFALISYARTGTPGRLRPFLNVQVQLWLRELRRFIGKVSPDNVTYAIAHDLNANQSKQYLPIVNCRDCGSTGWASLLNERQNATLNNLDAFYNNFFRCDDKIAMMFPYAEGEIPIGAMPARLCPDCLQVKYGDGAGSQCENCGTDTIPVYIPQRNTYGKGNNKQYICPCCGSRSGLSLIGLRSATEISAGISQLFASKFNDDKKTLAFSDNVQDAAHRAGFFNSRTWKFGIRTAIQRYVQNGGAGRSLEDFTKGFLAYWHAEMTDEDFVGYFIAPNMTWMRAYEDMLENRVLKKNASSDKLISDIERRLNYEIMQEYGMQSKIGRTLVKSACSCLAFDPSEIARAAETVRERAINELGVSSELPTTIFELMVHGFLDIMRQNGAFADPVYAAFVREKGKDYLLSNSHLKWLPGVHGGKNAPHFIAVPSATGGARLWGFDVLSSGKYTRWIESCMLSTNKVLISQSAPAEINRFILEALIKAGIAVAMDSPAEYTAYGINKSKIYVSDQVVAYQCDKCGTVNYFPAENAAVWKNAPCSRNTCDGLLLEKDDAALDYYGKLFSGGDMARINAREHTGLLERNNREALEIDFKRKKEEQKLWDPNVLSCTPTLEMGIDIGDLSTVILCSMPPAQAQFLQRAGRAGRKDGNALTIAVASARPHDLYFYADPLDMIAGQVAAPKIFLKASAVLERQFVAYCMDSWVKKGVPEGAIPKKVGICLGKLDSKPSDVFPFNFLQYVKSNLTSRLNSFIQMFAEQLDDTARDELTVFVRGNGVKESPMYLKLLEAFIGLKKQDDALKNSIGQLKDMIDELKAKPYDSSYDEEIKELKYEEAALINVRKDLKNKDVFNFLSDEGLLPNYAFPEAGIVLKAVLWRNEDDESDDGAKQTGRKYEKKVYEYSRGASSAISEFAPNNSFYVEGKKLTIDQIDMATAQTAPWRLCPNCSHAQIEEAGKNTACCPQCGSPAWADAGQVRDMLKVQMVYSNMDYKKSTFGDESEDRTAIFYNKQLLVDVDEEHDIASAYRMNNEEFSFGYEFVKKAKLREINFGENDTVGESLTIAGEESVRKGFRICKYCGKVQSENGKAIHTKFCKTQKFPNLLEESTASYLFLFREFQTEILRLLIPATSMDATRVKTESFVAAFMLGMKEYFGNVDHLRATVSEVPVPEAEYRKQYLVIYDSVPGGTGYLKQLMHEENALVEIFEKALTVMENCSCKDDPQKDGCYHCLYAYRQSNQIGSISRSAAIHMLKAILSGKDNVEKIDKLGNIPVNSLFDSELERRFIEAIASMGNDSRKISISNALVKNKQGYLLTVNDITWEIEPQRLLDAADGVSVTCKPDFVFWPVSDKSKKPVAVFTDGFVYHKDKVADDTLKREAIRRSKHFRVWAFSWKDVQSVFQVQGIYATDTLTPENMPSGSKMYIPAVNNSKATGIVPAKMSAMELFVRYLSMNNAEDLFKAQSHAYALSLLEPLKLKDSLGFNDWNAVAAKIENDAIFNNCSFTFSETIFGKWIPRATNSNLMILAGIGISEMKADKNADIPVFAVLDDLLSTRTDKYEEEWNGFWHFFNVLQFDPFFIAVSKSGIEQMVYLALNNAVVTDTRPAMSASEAIDPWKEAIALLFDDESIKLAEQLKSKGIAPGEVGYELADESGEVIATIELAWPDRKIGYLIEEQYDDKEKLLSLGWTLIHNIEDFDVNLFGGVMND